ncbi:hypothetical protein CU098_006557 [Rhizopus stolonifer]|uniref:SET domain-containing protein n=1 Tax=Rhizopus stolonifer TaxID=4846 RepID=A0A367JKV2_RHIST|nr:hypothetical protein CU098_006557 [Rhizopus stolonifer]
MNSDFVGTAVDEQKVIDVIHNHLFKSTMGDGLRRAAAAFLEFPYFKDFISDLPKKQALEFSQHMKRYLAMYMPNAGFEVSSTKRYTGQMEACIVATKDWKAGEQVKYCLGSIAELTEEDDAKLKREGRDFSVMVSQRKKCSCLFLGPARFMNHDCDANCSFILIGQNAITFRIERDIACGEEMTVFYAEHYFGEDNCECRCSSCERLQQGSFSVQISDEEEQEASSGTSTSLEEDSSARRSGRKRKQVNYKDYFIATANKKSKQFSPEDDKQVLTDNPSNPPEAQDIFDFAFFDSDRSKEMNLWFICHDQAKSQLPRDKLFDTCWSKGEYDAMDQFYAWIDDQSDISDTEDARSHISHVQTAHCCKNASDFDTIKTSEGHLFCARCYRHYKIFGHEWPLRREKRIHPKTKQSLKLAAQLCASPPPPPSPLPLIPVSLSSNPPKPVRRKRTLQKKKDKKPEKEVPSEPRFVHVWTSLPSTFTHIQASAPVEHQIEETLLAVDRSHDKPLLKPHQRLDAEIRSKKEHLRELIERRGLLQELIQKYKQLCQNPSELESAADKTIVPKCNQSSTTITNILPKKSISETKAYSPPSTCIEKPVVSDTPVIPNPTTEKKTEMTSTEQDPIAAAVRKMHQNYSKEPIKPSSPPKSLGVFADDPLVRMQTYSSVETSNDNDNDENDPVIKALHRKSQQYKEQGRKATQKETRSTRSNEPTKPKEMDTVHCQVAAQDHKVLPMKPVEHKKPASKRRTSYSASTTTRRLSSGKTAIPIPVPTPNR